ncbi:MAG: hypothetical protein PHC92_05175, partial [Syntrophomonadaceae bacterium]|nr:hypothetical protein [Syntrophomonadaceae bacterium]
LPVIIAAVEKQSKMTWRWMDCFAALAMTYMIARDVRQYGILTVYFIAFSGFSACSFGQKVELIITS